MELLLYQMKLVTHIPPLLCLLPIPSPRRRSNPRWQSVFFQVIQPATKYIRCGGVVVQLSLRASRSICERESERERSHSTFCFGINIGSYENTEKKEANVDRKNHSRRGYKCTSCEPISSTRTVVVQWCKGRL